MTEFYTRIYWYNKSDNLTTPLGKTNLNKMDSAIKTLDGRTVELYTETVRLNTAKADKSQLNGMVTNWQVDNKTGIVTLTKYDGTKISINTALNQLAVNFEYNSATQQLIITQTDGTKKIVDMSALITQYEFLDSDTITFEVQSDGKIKAIVRGGSIKEEHLDPDYLAEIKVEIAKAQGYVKDAQDSADNAAYDAKLSQSYAVGKSGIREGEDTDNSKYYSEQAKDFYENAASITSYKTEYQSSDSGSTIPDGTWEEQIPEVGKGQYLWTRITISLSNGESLIAYSVSYFGTDGSGNGGQSFLADDKERPIVTDIDEPLAVWGQLPLLGVKGNAEKNYRDEQYINLTIDDIGLTAQDIEKALGFMPGQGGGGEADTSKEALSVVNAYGDTAGNINTDFSLSEYTNKLTYTVVNYQGYNVQLLNLGFPTGGEGRTNRLGVQLMIDHYSDEIKLRAQESNKTYNAWCTFLNDVNIARYAVISKTVDATIANATNANSIIYNIENDSELVSGYFKYWHVLNMGGYSEGYASQIAMPYQNSLSDSEMFIRTANGSTWRNFRRVCHDGNINSMLYFRSTSSYSVPADDTSSNYIGYTKPVSLFGQTDGALYKQVYEAKWAHEIFGDYRSGQIAVRSKNNGVWQNWRIILDSGNYTSYAMGEKSANGYWGLAPGGADNVWCRTTSQGIIPYQQGNAGSGHCGLGTSTWYFENSWIDNMNGVDLRLKALKTNNYSQGGGGYISAPVTNNPAMSDVLITASSESTVSTMGGVYFEFVGASKPHPKILSQADGCGYIGDSTKKWNQFYATNTAISSSDRNLKCNISYIGKNSDYDNTYMSDDTLTEFVMGLLPCIFNRIDGESGRPHHGFISQDIEELLKRLGIKDHAGFIKSPKTVEVEREVEEEITNEDGTVEAVKKTVKEPEEIPGEYVYSLRYEEFIPDNVRFSQILYRKIEEQAEIIQQQQQEIEELKNRMARLEALVLD